MDVGGAWMGVKTQYVTPCREAPSPSRPPSASATLTVAEKRRPAIMDLFPLFSASASMSMQQWKSAESSFDLLILAIACAHDRGHTVMA